MIVSFTSIVIVVVLMLYVMYQLDKQNKMILENTQTVASYGQGLHFIPHPPEHQQQVNVMRGQAWQEQIPLAAPVASASPPTPPSSKIDLISP